MERRTIHFAGRVQGVGFRYCTLRAAGGHAVTGYVKNLPDGRVEVVAEGEPDQIDGFLVDLEKQMRGYIEDTSRQRGAATGEFEDFGVRF